MRNLLICFVFCVSCFSCGVAHVSREIQSTVDSTAYYKAKCDTALFLASQYEKYLIGYENERRALVDSIQVLNDSIVKLNTRPLMTKAQFIDLYRYGRVKKYYAICVRNPTQWKYIKGWLRRAIEE